MHMMRTLAAILGPTTLALASCTPYPPAGAQQGPVEELAGRAAGPPQRCVSIVSQQSLHPADRDHHILLYGYGRTIYANQLGPQCTFRSDDVLVMEPAGSFYCRGDIVRTFDRLSRIPGPACVLGDFVPYTAR